MTSVFGEELGEDAAEELLEEPKLGELDGSIEVCDQSGGEKKE